MRTPAVAVLAAVALWAAAPGDSAAAAGDARPATAGRQDDGGPVPGRQLYLVGCSSCHGADGGGTSQGPSLRRSGAAGAYYYLSTGRMPLADPGQQPQRKRPAYDAADIARLVAYVASLGPGPRLPAVDPSAGNLPEGGELFRAHCAPCHSAAGIGGALSYGRSAPSLDRSTPLQVAAAMRVGPGQMPVFGPDAFDRDQLDAVVRYVQYLRDPDSPGGAALGGAGPIPEGFVAWVFGLGTIVLAIVWIGTRASRP